MDSPLPSLTGLQRSTRSLRLARMAALRHVALRSLANAPMFRLSGAPGARLFRFRVAEIFVTTSPADTVRLDHAAIRRILLGLMLAMFLSALDQTIVATALATIGRAYADVQNLAWVVTAYLLAATAVTPLYGKLSDIH